LLARGELVRQGVINKQALARLNYLLSLRKPWIRALWILLNLELWFRFVQQPSAKPEGLQLSEL